jgi:hypothetical protein
VSVRVIPLPPNARVQGFLEPPELVAERERRKANSWFLVRNNGEAGERWPCRHCGTKHLYLTLACCERPFPSLIEGLFMFVQTVPDDPRAARMVLPLANIASRHPKMARALAGDEADTQQLFALSIGVVEPIEPWKAKLLIATINARRPLGGPITF